MQTDLGLCLRLATLRSGARDGVLIIVSQDMTRWVSARAIAPNLQALLDDWSQAAPRISALAEALEAGDAPSAPFDPAACLSPLPRAYQWADGSAYVNHVQLVRKARGAEMPDSFWSDPLMYQGGSDSFLAPCDPIPLADPSWGLDFEGEVAVIVGDVAQGAGIEEARAAIRLVTIVNDVSLRNLIPGELAKGFGFFQSKPSSAFAPVAASPAALGAAWEGGRLKATLVTHLNDALIGRPNTGVDMTFDFPALIAHAARTRPLAAGTIIGSGTVSNRDADGGPGRPICDGGLGYSCLAEVRTVETLTRGAPLTPFLTFGDRVRIEAVDAAGASLFCAIDQTVAGVGRPE